MLAQEQQQLKLAVDQPDPTSVHDDAARLGINSDPTDGDIVDRGRRRGRRHMALRKPQAKVDFRRWCGRHENIVDLPPAVDITETALRDDRKDGVRVGVAPEAPANRSSRHEICTRIDKENGRTSSRSFHGCRPHPYPRTKQLQRRKNILGLVVATRDENHLVHRRTPLGGR
jgi:sRNA-binding carbon storage regulator CsrA